MTNTSKLRPRIGLCERSALNKLFIDSINSSSFMESIPKSTIQFLKKLHKNNNRDWFEEHKSTYLEVKADTESFLEAWENEMNKSDVIGKSKLFRIYRDVRFSKDKTPYKSHLAMSLHREGHLRRGGYYLHIKLGESFLACGFWKPEKEDLKLIRSHIAVDAKALKKILKAKTFVNSFGELKGDQLKSAPRGFDKNHPDIDLLRYKQFILIREIKDEELMEKDFLKKTVKHFKAARPFLDYMTDLLTHDLNGEPLYEKKKG